MDRIKRAIANAKRNLRSLDLAKLRDRIQEAKAQRARKNKGRKQFQDERDDKRETLERLLDDGHSPDEERLKDLEKDITRDDLRAEELHNVVTRRTQLLRRLKPKNMKRTKQRHDLAVRIRDRRRKLRAAIKRHQHDTVPSGITTYDGKPVAAHFVPWLNKIRAAGWNGVLVSGFRTPAYSQSLCYAMCGLPQCPGRCAGIASKHSQYLPIDGAVDLSDYYNAGNRFKQVGAPYFNALPSDPVHFSNTGH